MSGNFKKKVSSNAADTLTTNEKILRQCHDIYTNEDNGLCYIAESLGIQLLAPRKKINVLLIGNHSAGKSTFVNWYVEEHVQKTGVAIETQGFTFVTSGRKRESLQGKATLHLYPHYKPLQEIPGVVDYMSTEITTSKQKKFSLLTFIDTPGLVDGDMKYPFDVNKSILWLGNLADLIFVFFDPIGQALCKRTMDLVEQLNNSHGEKIRFYLSKADEAGHEADRQRVLMQIVQELCKRPGLNKAGFDMPTIYIPSISGKPSRCVNQIEEVCKDIEKTINHTIQNTLNSLENDCKTIAETVASKLNADSKVSSDNLRSTSKGLLLSFAGLVLPFILLFNFAVSSFSPQTIKNTLGDDGFQIVHSYLKPVDRMWDRIPVEYHMYTFIGIGLSSLLALLIAKFCSHTRPVLSRKQKRLLESKRAYVAADVLRKKEQLYSSYLEQSVAAGDMG